MNSPSDLSALPSSIKTTSSRGYYLGQFGGWSAYAILIYLMSRPTSPGYASRLFLWCACGMIGTHLLRTYNKLCPWRTVPELLRRSTLAVLVTSLAMVLVQLAANTRMERHVSYGLFPHYFQALSLILLWCGLYFSANEIRRRQRAETEALQLALEAKVAQLRVLRSQLNPHFLFNTLNGLRGLIDEDQECAKQALTQLSGLLRYTLHADRVETVSLQEELNAVGDYLSLEKIRFEERLQLHYDISPETLSAKVPPMLVQTLAENGVKHGIAKLKRGGQLSIAAYSENGSLKVRVTNPGSLTPGDRTMALGLDNARERLRLIYGTGASLVVDATHDSVCAMVTIPNSRTEGVYASAHY